MYYTDDEILNARYARSDKFRRFPDGAYTIFDMDYEILPDEFGSDMHGLDMDINERKLVPPSRGRDNWYMDLAVVAGNGLTGTIHLDKSHIDPLMRGKPFRVNFWLHSDAQTVPVKADFTPHPIDRDFWHITCYVGPVCPKNV